jgi:hemerythrin
LALLTWNHACAVGVRAMDDQHGILMDTVNELRLANARGADREQILELLNRLIDFTRLHFAGEEQLMEQYGYPARSEHAGEHQRLLFHLMEASRWVQHGNAVSMRVLLGFLRRWFLEHIQGLDRQYGPWLNERGVF